MQTAIWKKLGLASVSVILVALMVVLAIFVKPKEKIRTLANPDAIIAGASTSGLWDTKFADKVMNTVFFALVLTSNEYTGQNADALEALRSWAAREFHSDPRFLHPVVIPAPVANSTYLNAGVYNLFAGPYYSAQSLACDYLTSRIDSYSKSKSFDAFAENCFEFFGREPEAAAMLARYQSDRAKSAINPLLSMIYFLALIVLSPLATRPLRAKAEIWRRPLRPSEVEGAPLAALISYASFTIAGFYFAQSVVLEGLAGQSLLAAFVALIAGFYVLFPLSVSIDSQNVMTLRSALSKRTMLTFAFVMGSLLTIQALNWLKQGSLAAPDPLSLLLSSFTGDFIHEPAQAKKLLATTIAVAWSISLALVLRSLSRQGGVSSREVAKRLAENARSL